MLEGEARRRGVPLAQVLREAVEREAGRLRRAAAPRFGIVRGDGTATRAIAVTSTRQRDEAAVPHSWVALVLDTGPIVALLDAADPEHDRCVAMVDEVREDLVIPAAVLVEVDYWLRKLYGPEPWRTFVEDIASGAYRLHHLDEDGLVRAAEIEHTYDSLDLGLVDVAVMVTCERLGERKVATLDRSDFSVVRPQHCDSLTLLPE